MAMRIILKHSSVEDQRPTVEQAGQAGELLLNTNTALARSSAARTAQGKSTKSVASRSAPAAPANPVKGTVWLDIAFGVDRGLLKVYNGSQWVTGGGTFDACVDGGLVQDPGTGCWSVSLSIDDLTDVDTSTTAPLEGEILVWDGSNWVPESLADVQLDWSDLPACAGGGLIYDATNEVLESFSGLHSQAARTLSGTPSDELWNVMILLIPPVEISDTAPDFKAEYFWWNSDTGEHCF